MKKLLVMTLVLTMVCTMFATSFTSYASGNVTFVGNNVEVEAGSQAVITVSVENGADNYLAGAKVGIEYDPTYLSIPRRATTDHKIFGSAGQFTPETSNPFYYLAGEGVAIEADGAMFSVKIDVAADAPAGVYPIKVVYVGGKNTVDDYLEPLECETIDGSITVKSSAPVDPYELSTDYVAAAKNIPVTSQYGSYNVNTALIFGSSINTGSATTFGTEITLKGYEGAPLDIVASEAAKYDAGAEKTGFTAAVTSIREANLDKAFVAKAYAIDANGAKVYGAEKEAVFNNVIAAN